MNKKINVLSLFDGISAGQLALKESGIIVDKYYASEIDKQSIKVTNKNFPETIQLGNVKKWEEWDIDFKSIDLIIAGSPCQGFSFAGKQLNFEDSRSKLFFTFLDICNKIADLNPKIKFFLENVKMKKEFENIISNYLGVKPIEINSSLLTAQNRKRLYWTNINKEILIPEDKKIMIQDIIQDDSEIINPEIIDHSSFISKNNDDFLIIPENTKKGFVELYPNNGIDLTFMTSKTRRGRLMEDKCNCLTYTNYIYCWYNGKYLRKLTPIECERLQGFSDNYTDSVSNSHRYKALGNGWSLPIIKHFFKELKNN